MRVGSSWVHAPYPAVPPRQPASHRRLTLIYQWYRRGVRWDLASALLLVTGCYFRPEGPMDNGGSGSDGDSGADATGDAAPRCAGASVWSPPTRLNILSVSGEDENDPAIRPQGRNLVFTANPGGDPNIYLSTANSPTGLTFDAATPTSLDGVSDLAWSGDGNTFYFANNGTYYMADFNGSQFSQIRSNADFQFASPVTHPTFRGDGLQMYFSNGVDLYVSTRTKAMNEMFTSEVMDADLSDLAWGDRSPSITADGLQIFFVSARLDNLPRVYTATRTTIAEPFASLRRLTELPFGVGTLTVNDAGTLMYLSMIGTSDTDLDLFVSQLLCQ